MILPLILIPIFSIIIIFNIYLFNRLYLSVFHLTKDRAYKFSYTFLRLISLISLSIDLAYASYLWKFYPIYNKALNILLFPADMNSLFELYHNLNLLFILLSILILLLSLLVVWYTHVNFILYVSLIMLLEICLVGAFSTTNIFIFLFFFELSALPIFVLMAYCGSTRKERIKATYYFLFFTLYGSISLLLVLISYSVISFQLYQNSDIINDKIYYILLFISFAIKLPLFPFHIWLPYAHVEASTATSIILAALMLKLGGYGIIKFLLPLFLSSSHLFYKPSILFLCTISLLYSSLASIRQIDLKRQIAFSSIAHMSFSTIGIFTFTQIGIKGALYLMLSHGLTSTALFFIAGILSERFHTRSILCFSGLMNIMPLFSFFLIINSLANVGFPLTSGFLPEFYILISIISSNINLLLPLLLGMFLTTAGSLLVLLRILFGSTKLTYIKTAFLDINKLEFTVLFIISFIILVAGLKDPIQNNNYLFQLITENIK